MNTLRYKISIILAGGLFLGIVGCTNLEDKVLDRPTQSSAGSNLDPVSLLNGVYAQLNPLVSQENVYAMEEHTSDEMMGPTRGTDWDDFGTWRRLHQHTWDANHNQVTNAWDVVNTGVFRATEVIAAAEDGSVIEAQARFLRAFFMFYVVDLYGQAPFREASDGFEVNPKVLSRSEATDFIIQDLETALPTLPALGSGTNATPGRATKEAAQFLLAKVYLNRAVYKQNPEQPAGPYTFAAADMNKVIEYTNAIINSGKFELEPQGQYFDNFHWDNTTLSKELVFVIQQEKGAPVADVRSRYYMTLHYNQTPSGWNGFTTLADFYGSFEAQDERIGGAYPGMTDKLGYNAGFLVGQQKGPSGANLQDRGGNPLVFSPTVNLLYSDEKVGIRVIKYLPEPGNIDQGGHDYVFFRYADALLMNAEATLRGGTGGSPAVDLVNQVRNARGLSNLSSVTEADLLKERGHELYWEGWRRNDLIRFGTFLEPFDQKPTTSPAHVVVFPIPQRALDTNPNLKQNFGY
ncbi:RagB/SusD family nutrient uptake outer membrane protein [Cytophagaceae bacterium YF14B1]|uniref:RagB/SusD family nutrient uptake outer membrane protein n=1 Tax=Xanthocytophaga flava TaxID=3048013 RepID=A0AAE3QVN2_9BACT|nr:RagB/SusD family nutrient uptake outer membrane protein [Xanthocytophaga flavus]MDJ1484243.1 RagB/SusD family nutrient uptake outer membrane protein [Xanthocytophaga flavus]